MSEKQKGVKKTQEVIQRMVNNHWSLRMKNTWSSYKKGSKLSDETIRKISDGTKLFWDNDDELKKKFSERNKGSKNPNFGKKHTDEAKKKCQKLQRYW